MRNFLPQLPVAVSESMVIGPADGHPTQNSQTPTARGTGAYRHILGSGVSPKPARSGRSGAVDGSSRNGGVRFFRTVLAVFLLLFGALVDTLPVQAQAMQSSVPSYPQDLSAVAGDGHVVLRWSAPANDGGADIVRYEVRHKIMGTPLDPTAWTSVGLATTHTASGLTNGVLHTFWVRAVNGQGDGPAWRVVKFPQGSPYAPRYPSATAGDSQVVLRWWWPANDGGASIDGYEVRHAEGASVPGDTAWTPVGHVWTHAVTGLNNGTLHTFEIRAVNRLGAGTAVRAQATLAAPVTLATALSAPQGLSAIAGDSQVVLRWSAPASDGGADIVRYEVRHAKGRSVPARAPWTSVGLATTHTVSGLPNGVQYAFEVRAVNGQGGGPAKRSPGFAIGPPSAPQELSATAGDSQVVLRWSASANDGGADIVRYEVRHAEGASVPDDTVWTPVGFATTHTVTGLTGGVVYKFELRAVNEVEPGAAAQAQATLSGLPSAPQLLFTEPGDGHVVLRWSAPANDGGFDIVRYEVRHAKGGSVPDDTAWTGVGLARTYTVSGLTNFVTYAFEVRAVNGQGGGPARKVRGTSFGLPSAPQDLSAAAGDSQVVLRWSAPASDGGFDLVSYDVRHAEGTSVPDDTAWTSVGLATTHTVTGLTAGAVYRFELRAASVLGSGPAAQAQATLNGLPSAPQLLSTESGDGHVVLRWSAPASDGGFDIVRYEVRHAEGRSVPDDTAWTGVGLARTYTVSGLTNFVTYAFEVRAVNGQGGGPARKVRGTSFGLPSAPQDLSAAAGDSQVVLRWSAPASDGGFDLVSYDVRHAEGTSVPDDTAWTSVGLATTHTVTGLTAGAVYRFELRAASVLGSGPAALVQATVTDVAGEAPGAPAFPVDRIELTVAENTPANTNIGAVIPAATDVDSGTLTYSMEGTDAASFNFNVSTRQITTKAGVTYDFETKPSYSVTIKVEDGNGGSDTVAVTINLTDLVETPGANTAPTFSGASTFSAPENKSWNLAQVQASDPDGDPVLCYDVVAGPDQDRFAVDFLGRISPSSGGEFNFENPLDVAGTNASGGTVTAGDNIYVFTVRATSGEAWSLPGGSCPPPTGVPTGSRLETTDQEVTLTITNVGGETNMTFANAPTVTAVSGSANALDIAWDAPSNRGPAIVYYEYSYYYRGVRTDVKVTAPTRSARITGLRSGTLYPVRVRGCNSDGTSGDPAVCSDSTTSRWSPTSYTRTNRGIAQAPRITRVGVPTGPGADRVYAHGDRIEVRVQFDIPVTVDTSLGTPTYGVALGGVRREATYQPGTAGVTASELVFALTVSGTDAGAGAGRSIANGLRLNGATIHGAGDAAAVLTFGKAPGVTGIEIGGDPSSDGSWTAGEAVTVAVSFAEPVQVSTSAGTPSVGLTLSGAGAKRALYSGGSGTNRLSFAYALGDADGSVSTAQVVANSLVLGGGTIVSTGGLNATLRNPAATRTLVAPPPPPPAPALSVADARGTEGGTLEFEVTLSPASQTQVTVAYATRAGTAQSEDYTSVSGTLSFAPGEQAKTVTVALVDDEFSEGTETVMLTLSQATGGATIEHAQGTGTIGASTGPDPLSASFGSVPSEHDGRTSFEVKLHISEEPQGLSYRTVHNGLFDVTGATIARAWRLVRGNNSGWGVRVVPSGLGAVRLTLRATTDCASTPGVCTSDGRMLGGGLQTTIAGPPTLSVADAQIEEASDAVLNFAVTLNRALTDPVTVEYGTEDGTAREGEDYTNTTGTLTFTAGQISKTISVPVLDDALDEGSETMRLRLRSPSPARVKLADASATGTINNTDPMPQAWMVRFGRTVGNQVVDALTQRLEGAGGSHVTVAGINVVGASGLEPEAEQDDPFGLPDWAKDAEREADARTITADDILLRSAFHLSSGAQGPGAGPAFTAWGRVATTGFEATVDDVAMDGDVTTGLVGFDAEWERALAGVMFSQSEGDGAYRLDAALGDESGTVESSLTGVYPYASVDLNARVSAWAFAGVGSGELTLRQEGAMPMPTDITMRMGAVGVKGRVLDAADANGLAMNVKSDATWIGMKSERTNEMIATEGDVTRLRLILEGERSFETASGATFTPSAEVGLRHDGGDAETGTGLEVGAGVRYTAGLLTIEGQVRTLVAHEASGYEEWGVSGAIRVTPSASGQGWTLAIAPAWGRTGSGSDRLWGAHSAHALGEDTEFEAAGRVEMDAGYGFGLPDNRGVLTPYGGMTLGDAGNRAMRTGARWQLTPDAVVGVEATRQTSDAGEGANEVKLRAALRF